ncbi:hypothetical protein CMI47_22910, partial [Candidatus Pacearchaeota archaeon]|nr:hypothetical protein [Candidatus Pacearchaeota archaeon]
EGDYNVASGYQALRSNTEGNYNVASGYAALYSNTEGDNNVASGYKALYNNTEGNRNVASGHAALYINTTGYINVATGYEAMWNNTTGHSNVATGYKALRTNTTGYSNVACGYKALHNNTDGYRNSALGYKSGLIGTTGSNNTFIGYNAQPSSATVSNEIVLGDSNVTLIHSVAGMSMGGGATFGGVVGITGSGNHIQFPDGTTQGTSHTQDTYEIIGVHVDNGSSVLTTGTKGHRVLPYDCEVTEWTVTSTDSGSIEWGINWCTYANWPTTASVGGSGFPQIDEAYKGQDTSITAWTKTTFDAGDIIEFEIDDVTTLTNCNLALKIRRTS